MQTDMHYYGTYALARCAGFRADIARTIATAAEYVDDSDRIDVVCVDGFEIHAEPTAHHPTNLKDNSDPQDQRRTWVPFHFIPGNVGATVEERLRCVTDSPIARAVIDNTLNNLNRPFSVPLLGILAHSFIDTFSHYGFSGISSSVNRVDPDSFTFDCSSQTQDSLGTLFDNFLARYVVGPLANLRLQLGHGSVATYPDQPFLRWQFSYMDPVRASGLRDNPATFLAGCRRLYDVLVSARDRFNGIHDDRSAYRDFTDVEQTIRRILAVEGNASMRAAAWKRAAASSLLYGGPEPIPDYNSRMFTDDLEALHRFEGRFATRTLVYGFLEAAEFHRTFLLNDLLPRVGIRIESAPIEWHS